MIKVLLIDDHKLIIDGLTALLSNVPDIRVVSSAKNGREALAIMKLVDVDLVLIDIDMPVLNGFETTQIIKKEYGNTKVIILSMHSESGMIKELIEIGADGYLLKNSSKDELVGAIVKVMQGERYFSPDVTMSLAEVKPEKQTNLPDIYLTKREIEIIKYIAEGYTNKEIGERLFISHRTVDTHRTNLMRKLEINNLAGIVNYAIKSGLLN